MFVLALQNFLDVTNAAGLRFLHQNSATADKFLPETMGSGAAFLDFDSDGFLDVFLVNGGWMPGTDKERAFAHALYRNQRDGTFRDVTPSAGIRNTAYGMGVAVGDTDNDGYVDLFISYFGGANVLYHNNGDGTFADVTGKAGVGGPGQWSTSSAFLDYDNDGWLDLWTTRYVDFTIEKNKICGPFAEKGIRGYCTPQVYDGLSNLLYRNNHDGTFTDVSERAGLSRLKGKGLGIAVTDYDKDGFVDVYIANDSVANFLFHNNRDGTFTDVALEAGVALDENGQPQAGMGTVAGDIDLDGFPDLLVTNLDFEYLAVYRNLRNAIFEDASARTGMQLATRAYVGFGIGLLDFDNDQDLDVLVANGHILDNAPLIREGATFKQRKLLFENTGGRFREVAASHGAALSAPQVSRGLAIGDFDNDGFQDALVTNNGGTPMLLRNSGNRSAWLAVALEGRAANRQGIGAVVEIKAGTRTVRKEVSATGSYLSSHDPRVHFGLGDYAGPIELTVTWPGGKVQRLAGVQPRQILKVREDAR